MTVNINKGTFKWLLRTNIDDEIGVGVSFSALFMRVNILAIDKLFPFIDWSARRRLLRDG
ncbi:hypothetical protein [Psychrobacillus sp. MER TA 171]|uniref:hypothetical protein n=1 Tax=Psychrobacillus sp. MER TA 171 TaxID=2939577 RepID=UPI00203DF103|nr:hypothetical protein [Psychrobacillus sp. MER TA 171]